VFADESNAESLLLFTIRETPRIGLSPETGTLLLIVEKVDRDPDDSEICKAAPWLLNNLSVYPGLPCRI
jgi:hypothetical protein